MPYFPPPGAGGGGSGTPGGADSQIQVNSQNAFAGFPNLRWIGSSNELNLNSTGRIRNGGVAEVDGTAPAGVTGLLWLDTSSTLISSFVNTAALATTGPYYVLQSGNSTLPNSQVLKSGSSTIVRTDGAGSIYVDATTGGGSGGTKGWENFIVGKNTAMFLSGGRRDVLAGYVNAGVFAANSGYGANSAYCYPFLVMRSMAIDSMSAVLIVASGSAQAQMGIYTNSADNIPFPFQAVVTSGYVTASNAAQNPFFTLNQVLSSNTLYWAVYMQTQTSQMLSMPLANSFPILGVQDANGSATGAVGWQIAMVGTLPATMMGSGNPLTVAGPILAFHTSG